MAETIVKVRPHKRKRALGWGTGTGGACCCHDLQFLTGYGRGDLIAYSEYVAWTEVGLCTHCGDCIERCVFESRIWEGELMVYQPDACRGCGLCVTVCPVEATVMQRRRKQTD